MSVTTFDKRTWPNRTIPIPKKKPLAQMLKGKQQKWEAIKTKFKWRKGTTPGDV